MKRRKGLLDEEKFLPPLPEQLPRGVSSLPGYGQTSPVAQGLLGFTGRNPTYSVMSPEAQQMSDAYRLGEQASVASQFYGSVLPFAAASTMASAQRAGSLLSPLTVFHGSPHKFKKFDASKIGTGEGAQAYGHGLYFAENPAVAKSYQSVGGYLSNDPVRMAADTVSSHGSEKKALSHLQSILPPVGETTFTGHTRDQIEKAISAIKSGQHKEVSGSLYTVDIPDEKIAQMLDWDKPLSQQPKAVQEFAKSKDPNLASKEPHFLAPSGEIFHWTELLENIDQLKDKKMREMSPKIFGGGEWVDYGDYLLSKTTGGDFYRSLSAPSEWSKQASIGAGRTGFDDVETSALLREAGIPGIRYLDQGSRGKGGTSNFVVFPGEESKLRIMEINGKPVVIDEEELRRSGLLGVAQ